MGRKRLGIIGELLAALYLILKFYKIIARNYRTRYGEIDIICFKHRTLIFVEVKARRTAKYGVETAVTAAKQRRIFNAAAMYVKNNKAYSSYKIRFDVIAINFSRAPYIKHYKNAFNISEF